MGYKVPELEQANEYLGMQGNFFNYLNGTGQVAAMRELLEAYWTYDNFERGAKVAGWYDKLYNLCNELGLTDGKTKEEFFPDRNGQTFNGDFRKLWNSLEVYYEMKTGKDTELANNASLPEIYKNYSTTYERYLIADEVFDTLNEKEILKPGDYPDELRSSLKRLYFYNASLKKDEPFNDSELEKIHEETNKLNRQFRRNPREDRKKGLFSGEEIKTSADLQNYIDRYETMLMDLSRYGNTTHFGNYGSIYEEEEHEINKFEPGKVAYLNREKNEAKFQDEDDKNWKKLVNLESDSRLKATIEKETAQAQEKFDKECEAGNITTDKEFEELKAEYYQVKKDCEADLEWYRGIQRKTGVSVERGDWDSKKKDCDAFDTALFKAKANFGDYYENAIKREYQNFKDSTGTYKNKMKGSLADITKFGKDVRKLIKEQSEKQKELDARPFDNDQRKLDSEVRDRKISVVNKVNEVSIDREAMTTDLKNSSVDIAKKIVKLRKEELAHKKEVLRKSIADMKAAKADIKSKYENSAYGKKIESQNNNIREKLTEITDVLKDEKKTYLKIFKKADSGKYVDMMSAIQKFQNGEISAEAAHKACEEYLKKSIDIGKEKITGMKSDIGKLRKQSCVRMMELLSQVKGFDKSKAGFMLQNDDVKEADKAGNEKTDTNKKAVDKKDTKSVKKDKISYKALEESLAKKSDSVKSKTKDENKKRREKAFSNLNKKIEAKKADLKKEAPVKHS